MFKTCYTVSSVLDIYSENIYNKAYYTNAIANNSKFIFFYEFFHDFVNQTFYSFYDHNNCKRI